MRAMAQRFSLAILLMASIALMMLGKIDAVALDAVRGRLTDALSPILDAVSRPAAAVADMVDQVRMLAEYRELNRRLAAENAALLQFRDAAFRLEAENLSLRLLLNHRPELPHAYITARVIADNSGPFVRNLMVNLGTANGVRDGQAVLGGHGLIGRIVRAGERQARVLLITDFNARIPIRLENSRHRGVLGGDNSELPRLLYLPPDAQPAVGDRVVTQGEDGMFPPGLAIGAIAAVEDGVVRVRPFEDLSRVEYVRIVETRSSGDGAAMVALPGFAR